MMKMDSLLRRILPLFLLFSLLLTAASCSKGKREDFAKETVPLYDAGDYAADADAYPGEPLEKEKRAADTTDKATAPTDRMIIRRAEVTGEALQYEEAITGLKKSVTDHGGYIESSRQTDRGYGNEEALRRSDFTFRIPAGEYDAFMKALDGIVNITSISETSDDVTLQFEDTESRMKAYRAEEASLLAMLEEAKDLDSILKIRDRLTELRYQIESTQTLLNRLSDQVSYCTVALSLYEVKELTVVEEKNLTVWQEIRERFGESLDEVLTDLRDGFVTVIGDSPQIFVTVFILSLPALLAGLIVLIVRKTRKRRRIRNDKSMQEK